MNEPDINKSLMDSILKSDPQALAKAADAGSRYIKARTREGDAKSLITHMMLDPETALVTARP